MMTENISFTREELYELVWAEPMQTLAPRFGISDVALAKNCRKLGVPLPGRGYWAKKAAGKPVGTRPPLTELPPNTSITPRTLSLPVPSADGAGDLKRPAVSATPQLPPVAAQTAFEAKPKNRIMVPATLRDPHKLTQKTTEAVKGDAVRDERFPMYDAKPRLSISVTKPSFNRALRIIDTCIKAFERRGWRTAVTNLDAQRYPSRFGTYVSVLDQQVFFGIREETRRVTVPTEQRSPGSKKTQEGTGRLSLVIYEAWTDRVQREFSEEEPGKLEGQLNMFAVEIVTAAFVALQEMAYRLDEWEREKKENERREAARQRREDHANKERALLKQARDWALSQNLLAYVSALRDAAKQRPDGPAADSELAAWLHWAEGYAQSLDPFRYSLEELAADRVQSPTEQPSGYSLSHVEKPQAPWWFVRNR